MKKGQSNVNQKEVNEYASEYTNAKNAWLKQYDLITQKYSK